MTQQPEPFKFLELSKEPGDDFYQAILKKEDLEDIMGGPPLEITPRDPLSHSLLWWGSETTNRTPKLEFLPPEKDMETLSKEITASLKSFNEKLVAMGLVQSFELSPIPIPEKLSTPPADPTDANPSA